MKILSVNAGSSSLKFQLISMPLEKKISSGTIERIGNKKSKIQLFFNGSKVIIKEPIQDHKVAVMRLTELLIENKILNDINDIDGVGHRVVQGGEIYKDSVIIDDKVIKKITKLSPLAPLHNPANLIGIKAFMSLLPNVNHVAVFDTTFHQTMPRENYLYSIPYELYKKNKIRKYGFHGTSYRYVSDEARKVLNNEKAKIIILHMGNGVSLCAVKANKSIDTSMGLTPLEGVPMGTRSGNVDPALVEYLRDNLQMDIDDVTKVLNEKSGFLGLSGYSSDSRDIIKKMHEGDKRSWLAHHVQIKRICDYIGSYYILLGGLDAIIFTAGIGENSPLVREHIIKRLKALDIYIDNDRNKVKKPFIISTDKSKIKALVIPTNEEVMIARDVVRLTKK